MDLVSNYCGGNDGKTWQTLVLAPEITLQVHSTEPTTGKTDGSKIDISCDNNGGPLYLQSTAHLICCTNTPLLSQ